MKTDGGQSLIEIAIAVPLLLMILIGVVDIGRMYQHTIALTTGAREGAMYAATLPARDDAAIEQRVCDAAGFAPLGTSCRGLRLADVRIGSGTQDAYVAVTYELDLLYGRILGAFAGPITLRASATFPRLGP